MASTAAMRGRIVACTAFVFAMFQFPILDLDAAKEWTIFEECRLIDHPSNDGDSFHVSHGDKEYLFRLYLVDAPETNARDPGRLIEQAKYFEISVPQAIEVGEAAKTFAREKLSKPFTVFTHLSEAMGSSKIDRLYGFVQTNEGDLAEQLVRAGLARVHGMRGAPPGAKTSKDEVAKLQQLESKARDEKIGGWGITSGRMNASPAQPGEFSLFVAGKETESRGKSAQARDQDAALVRIDINTATEKELEMIPGIGPKTAERIIAARPFNSADDLKSVDGISDKKYAKFRPYFK